MKATLEIDDDVMRAAEELGRQENRSPGSVISELARRALGVPPMKPDNPAEFLGFRPFASRGGVVTTDLVNKLREEDGD